VQQPPNAPCVDGDRLVADRPLLLANDQDIILGRIASGRIPNMEHLANEGLERVTHAGDPMLRFTRSPRWALV
jgi:hypothetical protein